MVSTNQENISFSTNKSDLSLKKGDAWSIIKTSLKLDLIKEVDMQTVGAFEAKTHFSALLEEVEKGEQIVITKHGRAVARLVPMGINKESVKEAIDGIKAFQSTHTLGLDWKQLRDEGRK